MDKIILVFYVGCGNVPYDEVRSHLERIQNIVHLNKKEVLSFFVPNRDSNSTKVECLNPYFITDQDMIDKFQSQLQSVDNKFEDILNQFKYKREVLIERT